MFSHQFQSFPSTSNRVAVGLDVFDSRCRWRRHSGTTPTLTHTTASRTRFGPTSTSERAQILHHPTNTHGSNCNSADRLFRAKCIFSSSIGVGGCKLSFKVDLVGNGSFAVGGLWSQSQKHRDGVAVETWSDEDWGTHCSSIGRLQLPCDT